MATLPSRALQPHGKRQKLSENSYLPVDVSANSQTDEQHVSITTDSPSVGSPRNGSQTPISSVEHSLDERIAAGCIRISRQEHGIAQALWNSCDEWATCALQQSEDSLNAEFRLGKELEDALLSSSVVSVFKTLWKEGLVQLEFKSNNVEHGQFRVYLWDQASKKVMSIADHGKPIKRAFKQLLQSLDLSPAVWNGNWTSDTLVQHISTSAVLEDVNEDKTLIQLFNDLPSPNPSTSALRLAYDKNILEMVLRGELYGLLTTLYPHQKRSAALMLQREVEPGLIIDPRLKELLDHNGNVWYCDIDDCYYTRTPRWYDGPRGGILAENMGLGKTVICLALILATRDQSSRIPPEHSLELLTKRRQTGSLLQMAAAAVSHHGIPWKTEFEQAASDGVELTRARNAIKAQPGFYYIKPVVNPRMSRTRSAAPVKCKILLCTTTLVVVPSNLIQQWINEINKHTSNLQVLVMKEMGQELPEANTLIDYDIILFTKSRFDREARGGRLESSPLRGIHFKRLIFDEGHAFGSATASSPTDTFTIINNLHISARWIVSGTPSQGLYDLGTISSQAITTAANTSIPQAPSPTPNTASTDRFAVEQERKDLVRLGNIAMYFLRARPWASSTDNDVAQWQQYALQPRHGEKSRGNIDCLRRTLEGMMIRHRLSDVENDIELPPLYQDVVYLEPCLQNKMMLNAFALMIITNAVTSERKDADYFFHPKQKKHLQALVSNMRQGSFFWSGFEVDHIKKTVAIAEGFLTDGNVQTSAQDVALLKQAIQYGKAIASNELFQNISINHEIPMYLRTKWPRPLRRALSLDNLADNPILFSAPMLFDALKYMHTEKHPTPQKMVIAAHQTTLRHEEAQEKQSLKSLKSNKTKKNAPEKVDTPEKESNLGPKLAGAATVGRDHAPLKLTRTKVKDVPLSWFDKKRMKELLNFERQVLGDKKSERALSDETSPTENHEDKDKMTLAAELRTMMESAWLLSTASVKLSYLLDRVMQHYKKEKIIIFYETSNIAFYIAQYLECLNIKHLIYATELKSDLRSRYVATFNTTDEFRVLLMDVSQAAFGLDMSSASRVYFISPVFSPQIEAQAVKRAHRIGQTKPVYIETLVLRGSIEEAIVARRNSISNEEHQKMKSLLDDETLYNWIRNMKPIPMDLGRVSGPKQMSLLATPQRVFGEHIKFDHSSNPTKGIVNLETSISGTSTPAGQPSRHSSKQPSSSRSNHVLK